MLRRKIRHGDLRRLTTWTNGAEGDGWETYRDALRDFMDWYYRDGRGLLGDSPVCVVAERGGQYGRIHLHAAVTKDVWLPYREIHASWSRHLEQRGHNSPNGSHRWHAGDEHGKGADGFASARTCAKYLAKYLTKGFEEEERQKYEKRFRSEGCYLPEVVRIGRGTLADVPDFLADVYQGYDIKATWFESPEGDYGGWWIEIDPQHSGGG